MNKEFIPYELQKELYELGFNDKTIGVIVYKKIGVNEFSFISEDHPTEWMSGVLYQQAFRWFRSEYALHSFVKGNFPMSTPLRFYYEIEEISDDYHYETYEEAELACLKKLIKIVKSK